MAHVADKYISESGRTADYDETAFKDDLMTTALFLAWAEEDGAEYGGKTAQEAMRAMCRMVNLNPRTLRKILKGEKLGDTE